MENLTYEIKSFKENFCKFWYLDIETAIKKADEVWINWDKLYEIMKEEADSIWIDINELDPVYIIYEYILQEARNNIIEITWFDFVNDWAEVCTYWNYMATSYDYRDEYLEIIKEKIKDFEKELKENIFTKNFLEELNIIS